MKLHVYQTVSLMDIVNPPKVKYLPPTSYNLSDMLDRFTQHRMSQYFGTVSPDLFKNQNKSKTTTTTTWKDLNHQLRDWYEQLFKDLREQHQYEVKLLQTYCTPEKVKQDYTFNVFVGLGVKNNISCGFLNQSGMA